MPKGNQVEKLEAASVELSTHSRAQRTEHRPVAARAVAGPPPHFEKPARPRHVCERVRARHATGWQCVSNAWSGHASSMRGTVWECTRRVVVMVMCGRVDVTGPQCVSVAGGT